MTDVRLTHVVSRWLHERPHGIRWEYVDSNTFKAVPIGRFGEMVVPVASDVQTDGVLLVRGTSTLNIALSSTGAGGRHPDYVSESADTGYDAYLIWGEADGLKGLAVEDGDTIVTGTAGAGEVSIDDVTGGTFTHWSRLSWFVRNDSSSNIIRFRQAAPGRCGYLTATTDLSILNNGTSVTPTHVLLDLTGRVPTNDTGSVLLWCDAENTGTTARNARIFADSGGTLLIAWGGLQVGNLSGHSRWGHNRPWLAVGDAAVGAAFWYSWSGAVTGGLDVYVMGWELKSN